MSDDEDEALDPVKAFDAFLEETLLDDVILASSHVDESPKGAPVVLGGYVQVGTSEPGTDARSRKESRNAQSILERSFDHKLEPVPRRLGGSSFIIKLATLGSLVAVTIIGACVVLAQETKHLSPEDFANLMISKKRINFASSSVGLNLTNLTSNVTPVLRLQDGHVTYKVQTHNSTKGTDNSSEVVAALSPRKKRGHVGKFHD